MSLLSIQNLSITFGNTPVVRDVSLALEAGEILAIVGESGSGKSLTAQSLLQLLPGNAVITGAAFFKSNIAQNLFTASQSDITQLRGSRIGMIFQEPMTALNPLHTIDRQVIEPYYLHHYIRRKSLKAREKLESLYAAVGLAHLAARGPLYPHQLSGGERQRAMIAMAIANDPDLLIADEPTTALDVTLQHQILMLLKELQQKRGMGMIFITHDLLAVREIADRVIVMRAGEIVEQNTTEQLFSAPHHAYTKMLLSAAPHGVVLPVKADAPEILRCDDLSVHFPVKSRILRRTLRTVEAVKGVSFRLHAGETLGVVGESGSGKSTLAYALLRLVKSEGPIVFLGNRIDTLTGRAVRPMRRAMQLVFQDPYGSLNPRMTVSDTIAEGLRLHEPMLTPADVTARVDEMMQQVGLTPAMRVRYPHEFSGGQRQRIAIARAMILRPSLVVLDEPTSALDMSVQRQVLELLKDLQQSHAVAYVFISHDLRVIRSVAHQVLVLKRGQVMEQGECATLFTNPTHPYTQALIKSAAFAD